jgi:putative ABC transport system permease protein
MSLWVTQLVTDFRFGMRNLTRSPGVTALAILSLGLGIGAATAMYSVIYAVILDPFPYKDVDNLMSIRTWDPARRGGRLYYSVDQYLDFAGRSTIFEGVIASTISDILWTGDAEPQRLRGNHGPFNTFEVMGVPALVGRYYTPADNAPGMDPVVVLGWKFWQRQFGGDPAVVGRKLRLDDTVRTIIGVMPKRFMWRGADVYVPVVFERGKAIAGVRFVHVLGRLKPGVTEAQAEADLRPIVDEMKRREPSEFPDKYRVGLLSFKETFPSGMRETLWTLFATVGLLLAIACANVSNLLLSKASSRQKEMALRAALGAARFRLIRQLLTESLVLAIAGGAAGALLAWGGQKAIHALIPPNIVPDESEIALNLPVLGFALAVSTLTALLFGLAPALHACTSDLANPLREAARSTTAGLRQRLLRGSLVVAEVGLSLMLLVGAGLMIRTLIAVHNLPFGFRPEGVMVMRVPLAPQRYPEPARRIAFFREALDRIATTPGVAAAGINTGIHPFGNMGAIVEVTGSTSRDTRPATIHQVDAGYLNVMGIPLAAGRLFGDAEIAGKYPVAVASREFVRRYVGERPAIGQRVRVTRLRQPPFNSPIDSFEIIGVVGDTVDDDNLTRAELYVPWTHTGMAQALVVRAHGDPSAIVNSLRRQIHAVDSNQPVQDLRTLESFMRDYVFARPKFNLALFTVFAAMGLTLAVVGVYGVISHAVAQRTQEIGVRMALGAGFGDVIRMVLAGGAKLIVIGLVAGLAGSIAGVRMLEGQVRNVSPFDAATFAAASAVLLAAGLLACYWPARRAARVDPTRALQHE